MQNKLYGWAMSQYLRSDVFKFIENVKLKHILNTSGESDMGYVLEVDLKYPDESSKNTFPILS